MYRNISQLSLAVGSVISNHASHKCVSRNTSKPVIRSETIHPDIRLSLCEPRRIIHHVYHICTDTSAYIVCACYTSRLHFKVIFQNPCGRIQPDAAAYRIAISIYASAYQGIILVQILAQIPMYIIKANHTAHKMSAHYQAGNRLHSYISGIAELNHPIIIACHSTYTVARACLPCLRYHAVNGLVVV